MPNPSALARALAPVLLEVTLSVDTAIYAADDLLADTQAIAGAVPQNGGSLLLQSVELLDEDDQGVAMDLVFLDANVSLGTENSAPSVTDANARNILGYVSIATGDYKDLGGSRIATVKNVNLILKATSATRTIYVAAITRGGTPTYTAAGLKLRLGCVPQ
jgi:hypothetical protein